MRLIDADKLSADMYHEAFEKDSDMQKWDSGCWIRYKMFENVLKAQPTVEAPDINVGSMDTTTHDSIPAKTGKNDDDRTSGDCISRQAALEAIGTLQTYKLFAGDDLLLIDQAEAQTELMMLPSVQPNTTTHDSNVVKKGGNDEDRTTDDLISRQQAIVAIEQHKTAVLEGHKWDEGIEYGYAAAHRHLVDIIKQLPSAQPETCEGCKHLGKWENEVEYGYPSPCTRCKRRVNDNYER